MTPFFGDTIDAFGFSNRALGFGAPQSARVRPGDLITAEFVNSILDRLDAIEGRLKQIEDSLSGIRPTPTFTPPTFTPPTFTPTIFPPTFTFHPPFTETFFPTFLTAPTFLTPTAIAPGGFNTFVATLVHPTLGAGGLPTMGLGGGLPTMGLGGGLNILQPSASILPAGSAIFHPSTEVSALPGVTDEHHVALNDVGIKTVQDVATADPQKVADALKTNVDNANVLISIAKNVMGQP